MLTVSGFIRVAKSEHNLRMRSLCDIGWTLSVCVLSRDAQLVIARRSFSNLAIGVPMERPLSPPMTARRPPGSVPPHATVCAGSDSRG